ncbi:RE2, partial [Symbiodinium sp. CCMP2592]
HLKHTDLMTEDAQKKSTEKGIRLLLDTLKEAIAAEQPGKINELFLTAFYSPAVWRRPAENMQQSIIRREQDFKRLEDVLAGSSVPANIRAMRDFLGCSRGASSLDLPPRPPKGFGKARRQTALVAEIDSEEALDDGDAGPDEVYEVAEYDQDGQEDEGDGTFDTWVQADLEDPEVAEALATLMQKRPQHKESQKGATGNPAVQFLKSVTPCTACGMKGHWQGDEACPKRKPGKGQGAKTKRKPAPKKVPGKTTYFVLSPDLEEGDGAGQAYYTDLLADPGGKESRPRFSNVAEHDAPALEHEALVNLRTNLCEHASSKGGREKKFHRAANGHMRSIMCKEPECDKAVIQAKRKDGVSLWSFLVQVALCTLWGSRARSRALFARVGQVRAEALSEREALAREAARERDEDARAQRLQLDRGYGLGRLADDESPTSGWKLVVNQSGATSSHDVPPVARIVRSELQPLRAWVYGVCLSTATELPKFPELATEDQDILMPLPSEVTLCGTEPPFCGSTFGQVSSCAESAWCCSQVMTFALGNNPMHPDVYRFAYFLYCKLKLLREAMVYSQHAGDAREGLKRDLLPGDMVTKRTLRVPVCMDPAHPELVVEHDCEVMVQEVIDSLPEPDGEVSPGGWVPENFTTAPEDPPGLVILDSGCTRTMHGSGWAEGFESQLRALGLAVHEVEKTQRFRGVGGMSLSTVTKIFPIGIQGVHGDLYSAEVEGNLPLLLSRPFMHELGAVLDLGANTVSFHSLGVVDLPLVKTQRGHIAVNLLDFDTAKLDEFEDGPPDFNHVRTIFAAEPDVDQFPDTAADTPAPARSTEVTAWMQETQAEIEEHQAGIGSQRGTSRSFPLTVNGDKQVMRKASSKKGKKILAMTAAVDALDTQNYYILRGKPRVTHKPPYGRVWVKHLFARHPGFSLLCAALGLALGAPLDESTAGWRSTTSDGRRQLNNDLRTEDPYLLVVTPPLLPHGSWTINDLGRDRPAALTSETLQLQQTKVLRLLNKVVRDRVKARRHIILEEPPGADWLADPEMKDVAAMVRSGELEAHCLESCGHPSCKPVTLITSMIAATDVMGKRTFPAEVREEQDTKRRRRTGRQAVLMPQYGAPPVYLRPAAPPQLAAQGDERTLGELVGIDPDAGPPDDADLRAARAAQLEPDLSFSESDRRRRWLEIDSNVRKVLRDLHVQFGHPTNVTLQRILRRQDAKIDAIKGFNFHLSLDVFYAKDVAMTLFAIVCEATGFQVVSCLGQSQGPPAGKVVLRHFLTSWSSWAGLPHSIQVDRGKEYLAGVEQETMPLEAPWKQGRVEKAGGLWKEVFKRAVHDMQLEGIDNMVLASSVVTQCRNSFPRSSGYSPNQWVLGRPEIRLPGSLLQDGEKQKLEVLEGSTRSVQALQVTRASQGDWCVPNLLPPVPEVPDDGGLFDAVETTVHRDPTQDQRTGGVMDVSDSQGQAQPVGALVPRDSAQDQRSYLPLKFYLKCHHKLLLNQCLVNLPHSTDRPYFVEDELAEEDHLPEPADVLLTGKAVRSKIKLASLSQGDREKFHEAMAKEWASWQKFGAVETLTPQQVKELPPGTKIVGTRWVHTDKNQKPRLLAGHIAKKTGKSKSQLEKDFPFQPKSRFVVQGCQEEDPGSIRSDSPTASLLAFNLLCAIAVMQKWVIAASDASTAYLQSQGINRLLILRPPRPPPPGVSPHDLFRAKGSIYGTKDAGRSWWKKLFRSLRRHGWVMSRIEAALFFLFDAGALVGIYLSHVDDLFSAGEGAKYEGSLAKLETELHLKVDQFDAIEGVDYMVLEKSRRKQPNQPLTEDEKSQFRGLIGQMGWIVRQSRPDLMVNVSIASQSLGKPCVRDVIDLNKAVKMMKETADAKWCFRESAITLECCKVACFADSSWANLEGMKSQCGFVVYLTIDEIKGGGLAPIWVLETYSGSIKRVCRSTLAAEANGFLTGVESAEYVRDLLLEVTNPGTKLIDMDRYYLKEKILAFTDAKSLESTLNRDTGQPQDKRVRILVAQIKEILGENDYNDERASAYAIWVDTSQMLADVLTKVGCEREPLLEALRTGQWRLEPYEEARLRKQAIRLGRQVRKAKLKGNEDVSTV